MQNHPIDAQWLTDTLTDVQETLGKALDLLQSDPRHAQGVLEHEIPALYAKVGKERWCGDKDNRLIVKS